jgi:hypothetical protein
MRSCRGQQAAPARAAERTHFIGEFTDKPASEARAPAFGHNGRSIRVDTSQPGFRRDSQAEEEENCL